MIITINNKLEVEEDSLIKLENDPDPSMAINQCICQQHKLMEREKNSLGEKARGRKEEYDTVKEEGKQREGPLAFIAVKVDSL